MKLISIVAPCFNEEANIDHFYDRVSAVFGAMPEYRFELLFIDNHSTDRSVEKIKALISQDPRVRLIVNVRNFGHIRSPVHGMLQASGDAVVFMASDLQDPPELLPQFAAKWSQGFKVAVGVKTGSRESRAMWLARSAYYKLLGQISDIRLLENYTGFGLYDRSVVEHVRATNDRYPYFRGLIPELGFEVARVPYEQPNRYRGITKNNFWTLYDMAMLGITSHSRAPIRLATFGGFFLGLLCLTISIGYLGWKIINWETFEFGLAPLLIGLFFFMSVNLFFIGLLGEYIGAIHTQVLKRPLVVELERVNFTQRTDSGGVDAPSPVTMHPGTVAPARS